jgi:hypothetical protein
MNLLNTLAPVITNAYILFCFALGIWAGFIAFRGQKLGGDFWGALWICTGLAVVGLLVFVLQLLSGQHFERPVINLLYGAYFIIALPGTFAILRGRDDRMAALIFAGVAIFSALSAISYVDAARIRPPLFQPDTTPIVTPTR